MYFYKQEIIKSKYASIMIEKLPFGAAFPAVDRGQRMFPIAEIAASNGPFFIILWPCFDFGKSMYFLSMGSTRQRLRLNNDVIGVDFDRHRSRPCWICTSISCEFPSLFVS